MLQRHNFCQCKNRPCHSVNPQTAGEVGDVEWGYGGESNFGMSGNLNFYCGRIGRYARHNADRTAGESCVRGKHRQRLVTLHGR